MTLAFVIVVALVGGLVGGGVYGAPGGGGWLEWAGVKKRAGAEKS